MNQTTTKSTGFSLGQIVATPGALRVFSSAFITQSLGRHARGDWGDVSKSDAILNNQSLKDGTRVLSCYKLDDQRLWIITEADRSSTCCLLPEEY